MRRQVAKDLPAAVAIVDNLADFRLVSTSTDANKKGKDKKGYKYKDNGNMKSSEAKEKNYQKDDSLSAKNKAIGCILCKGPHLARDCPKR